MAENRKADGAETLNPQHQPGGGDGASPSQIGSIAAATEPQRSQIEENLLGPAFPLSSSIHLSQVLAANLKLPPSFQAHFKLEAILPPRNR